jgi:hypothetical protein
MYYVLSIVLVFQEQYAVLLQSVFFLLCWWDVEVPAFCVAGILVSSTIKKQEVVKKTLLRFFSYLIFIGPCIIVIVEE